MDNVFVVSKIYILGRNPTFKRLLWVEFLVDKGPVGRILHWTKYLDLYSSSGDNFALQNKSIEG